MSENNGVKKEDWMNRKWRPAMAWLYLVVCVFDFIIFPIFWSVLQAYFKGSVTEPWVPLTIQGAGLFHLAMGAVLGIAAWSRGQEKIVGVHRDDYYDQRSPRNYNDNYHMRNKVPRSYDEEL